MDNRKIEFKIKIIGLKSQYNLEVGMTIEFKSPTSKWYIKLIEEVEKTGKYRRFRADGGTYYTEDFLIDKLNKKEAIIYF